jgi:uroporphyrin-III C-methyltransferase
MIIPKLTLLGAGPGDPELITLKGVRVLASANVVLYDHLACRELLEHCNENCEFVYVGKQGHKRGISQDKINKIIVEKALEKGHVVRLKGGDPFVFGRGVEEINHVLQYGIEFEYVPGVSSVNAIGLAGIPLTDRNHSDGYWVITGHKSDKSLSEDIRRAAASRATLVILMGMSRLAEISEILIQENKANTPAAIVQNAGTPSQKVGTGNASELNEIAEKCGLTNPAVIIIGSVVNAIAKSQSCYQSRLAS